jgi:hypothetical protein
MSSKKTNFTAEISPRATFEAPYLNAMLVEYDDSCLRAKARNL